MKKLSLLLIVSLLVVTSVVSVSAQKEVAVLTPYLQSVTTNSMIKSFQDEAEDENWKVSVIDTKGDFGALANRYQDVISQDVDAIVMGGGDPTQLKGSLQSAEEAGIPVFGLDAGYVESMEMNVTSNNYALGAQNAAYLFNKIGSGKIVKLYHSAYPPVHKREVVFDAMVESREGIEVVAKHFVEVPGPINDARKAMQSILLSNPDIDGVWAAWDEPAIGAAQAIRQAGKQDQITVVGIDGTRKALEMIENGSSLKATVKQNFEAMGEILADKVEQLFNGEEIKNKIIYAPSNLITQENVDEYLD